MRSLIPALGALGVLMIYSGLTSRTSGRSKAFGALDRLCQEAGGSLTAGRLAMVCCGLFGVSFLVVAGFTSAAVPAIVLATAASVAPIAMLRSRRASRREVFREQWPDAIATLIAGVRAGISLPEVCCSLSQRGPGDLRPGFSGLAATYRATGSFEAGLAKLRDTMADPVADRICVALGVAHDVGGNDLVRVLRTLSEFVREDLRVRKEIRARWSWTVSAARVAAASPWIVLLIMSLRPEAAAAYATGSGSMVILGGAVATVTGYRLMLRAARLPDDDRLET
ncbi:MAG TPA: type II secretion system F family protein [Actinomycetota bacterium]|nr:type II secretion system F family protein [Actinomycetota bacterium]